MGDSLLAGPHWAISQQLQRIRKDNVGVTEDILGVHWKILLESGHMTKHVSSCLKYEVADIIEEYNKHKKYELPKFAPNKELTQIKLTQGQVLNLRHVVNGRWTQLKKLDLSKNAMT